MPQHQLKFSLFGLDQKITSGVRYHAERLSDITGIGTAGSKISRTTNNADLESVAYAAYTETAIRLTEALTISPGIRWEQVNQSRETMNAVPPAGGNFKSYKATQGLIYGTGVKYQLTGAACCSAMSIRRSARRPSPMRSIRRAEPRKTSRLNVR